MWRGEGNALSFCPHKELLNLSVKVNAEWAQRIDVMIDF